MNLSWLRAIARLQIDVRGFTRFEATDEFDAASNSDPVGEADPDLLFRELDLGEKRAVIARVVADHASRILLRLLPQGRVGVRRV